MSDHSRILSITDDALAKFLEIRAAEPDGDELAVVLSIAGTEGAEFTYSMHMTRKDLLHPDDVIEDHGGLAVAIPPGSVANLTGATIGLSENLLKPGLHIDNPNTPSPQILGDGPPPDLDGPVAEQVSQVIMNQINPAIASHGGFVELVAVEEDLAYVRLGGGCQGCGLAAVTLSQGIESTIVAMVPDIEKVIDVTDHNAGQNPYYEQAKK